MALATGAWAAEPLARQAPAMPVVVVIDSGIAAGHPAFKGRLLVSQVVKPGLPAPLRVAEGKYWGGWDFVERDADPQDGTGHGTHVAGLVAGALGPVTDSQARVVMFRTGDQRHELVPVAEALEAVVALREAGWDVPVVLCAFDYRRRTEDGAAYDRFAKALGKLLESGVVCVCAAGNSRKDLDSSPDGMAQYQVAFRNPALIAVAVCADDGQLLAASNYGVKSVALAAPGLGAVSAAREGGTVAMSGASQAAARVAGCLANHAVTAKERRPEVLRAWLFKQVQVHPSLVGRVACAGFLPLEAVKKSE
ncbi:MAG: S8 family serine peptidase [Akkermansiaceae bacterium]|nr:S8 family serine peptidase [Akkermansiaceae bacterium]